MDAGTSPGAARLKLSPRAQLSSRSSWPARPRLRIDQAGPARGIMRGSNRLLIDLNNAYPPFIVGKAAASNRLLIDLPRLPMRFPAREVQPSASAISMS